MAFSRCVATIYKPANVFEAFEEKLVGAVNEPAKLFESICLFSDQNLFQKKLDSIAVSLFVDFLFDK